MNFSDLTMLPLFAGLLETPSPLVGEGFPPDARSATNGGKGEGGFIFLRCSPPPPPPPPAQRARVLSHKGRAGSVLLHFDQVCVLLAAARMSIRLMLSRGQLP